MDVVSAGAFLLLVYTIWNSTGWDQGESGAPFYFGKLPMIIFLVASLIIFFMYFG